MNPIEIASSIITILALFTAVEFRIKRLVKMYLSELKPNAGTSMKDQMTRLEAQVETILALIKK